MCFHVCSYPIIHWVTIHIAFIVHMIRCVSMCVYMPYTCITIYSEFPRFLEDCKRGLRPSVSAKIDENIKNIKIKVTPTLPHYYYYTTHINRALCILLYNRLTIWATGASLKA